MCSRDNTVFLCSFRFCDGDTFCPSFCGHLDYHLRKQKDGNTKLILSKHALRKRATVMDFKLVTHTSPLFGYSLILEQTRRINAGNLIIKC